MAQEQPDAKSDSQPVKLPLKMRLKAWWDGEELVVRQKPQQGEAAADAAAGEAPPAEAGPLWSPERIALAQEVWGEGLCGPTDSEVILRLIKPVGLTPAMRMLDLGAGLGGSTRIVAKQFGAWVTGLEADPDLAAEGSKISKGSELSKKATVGPFDPAALKTDEQPYDCIFSKEFLFQIEDKKAFLEQLRSLVKEPGHLVFTDYVLPGPGEAAPELAAWNAAEPVKPHPWTLENYVETLQALGFDVRVAEDFTESLKGEITAAWAAYLEAMQEKNPCGAAPPALAFEVGFWMRRVKLLEAGHLKVCRVHAVKKEGVALLDGQDEN